ncbi:2'-5' RNA ligase [Candidatus Gottesmanbacteria bacterium RBG_16_52_11]|uniref:RNA 2',3'-cyclic phosphodiesterase n=1 Tax=Candidatus Gottesmanbacteria bacterium RBG_16_52_11 TaxID=1798374 RepID=A0A1F5YXX4_9BACT|nr:MAG: 2'-5' RNA ligase [Candidatus Gottesmanbacteria bacterium RBG_16_52_11]
MKKRIFVCLTPPSVISRKILDIARAGIPRGIGRIRFTPADQLHITVLFLGAVERGISEAVSRQLGQVAETNAPVKLKLRDIITAPPGRPPTMLWAVFNDSDGFIKLAQQARKALQPLVPAPAAGRPQYAHITVARSRQLLPELLPIRIPEVIGDFRFDDLWLYESELSPRGAVYTPLAGYPLKGK